MHRIIALLILLPGPLLPGIAAAQTVQASYSAYAAGLNVVNMDADFAVQPGNYKVHLMYRTAGAFGLVMRARQETTVEGSFVAGKIAPQRFFSHGTMRGQQRITQIDYPSGQPTIRQLVPADDEREPVPPDRQANTIDTLSAMALLMRRVNETGQCDGKVATFDGRRLAELDARTGPTELLPPTSLSSFTGAALRCEFEGRQTGGFMRDADKADLAKPQRGSAWFAAVTPGGLKIPVRIAFQTRWFGQATMYLREPDK